MLYLDNIHEIKYCQLPDEAKMKEPKPSLTHTRGRASIALLPMAGFG